MNSAHQVFWTKVAEADLRAIVEYISINNPHNALKILKKIKDKSLKSKPPSGTRTHSTGASGSRDIAIQGIDCPSMADDIPNRGT